MSEASRKIADLIREGKKIEAIKLLRETTGVDLKQAKEEIERLSEGLAGTASPTTFHAGAASRSGAISTEVEELARQGKKIEAIKLLREETGMGLKEAKEKVDEVTGDVGGGCMSVLLLVLLIGAVVVIAGI